MLISLKEARKRLEEEEARFLEVCLMNNYVECISPSLFLRLLMALSGFDGYALSLVASRGAETKG